MSQGSSSVRASKGTEPKHGPTGLPLILCPVCEEYQIIERVSNTKANPRKRFFKCPRNEPNMPDKCTFFMWLERYQAHLVETAVISMDNFFPEDAIPELFELTDKLREDVKSMKGEITALKDCIASMKMSRQNLGGGEIMKFVCGVNVVLVVLLVMVLLFK